MSVAHFCACRASLRRGRGGWVRQQPSALSSCSSARLSTATRAAPRARPPSRCDATVRAPATPLQTACNTSADPAELFEPTLLLVCTPLPRAPR
eukprot:1188462-Prymnesium_polylepis.1